VSISTKSRRRATSAFSSCSSAVGSGRKAGCVRSANSASISGIERVGLGQLPGGAAKSLTWRGLTTAIGSPAAPNSATKAVSSPPLVHHHARDRQWAQAGDQRLNTSLVITHTVQLARLAQRHVQPGLAHIHSHPQPWPCSHPFPPTAQPPSCHLGVQAPPALASCKLALWRLRRLSGRGPVDAGAATHASRRSCETSNLAACRA
jgi:hypothetical protein